MESQQDSRGQSSTLVALSPELIILRKAVESSGEVVFMTDREGIIRYANPEFTKLYGYHAEEVIGKTTPRILKSGMMKPQDYEMLWEELLNKQVVKLELINKKKDGGLIFIESSANPIVDQDDNIVGFLAIQRDISERKSTEEALETAHAFQQSIIDGIAEPIMVIGVDYRVMLMNRAAKEFSTGHNSLTSSSLCYQISHQREIPCTGLEHPCPLEKVRVSNQPVTVVHEHYQANGELRLVELMAAPFLDANGSFQGIIESMRDITERERVKAALHQYTERLRALAAQLAEAEDAERQRLASELHDQVGQNLTALGINLNIIETQIPEEASAQVRFRLEDSLSLVEQTTEQIRDVMVNLRPPVLDDYGLVAALTWYGEGFSRRTDIAILVEGEEPIPRLPARSENALFRIVQEALTNVIKHAQATQVSVSVDVDNQLLRLVVTDDGIGFKTERPGEHAGELGWGILTMSERADAIGGSFRIESVLNQGTRVIVEVPR